MLNMKIYALIFHFQGVFILFMPPLIF